MRARRQRRRSRRGGFVLPACSRHPDGRGAPAPCRRFPARAGRGYWRPDDPRAFAAPAEPQARPAGGCVMNDLAAPRRRLALDPQALRREFPIYQNNPGLVFLDSGASAQKPAGVIRGVSQLSQRSTDHFEAGRETTRAFLNAADVNEIVFTRGATESVNLVAQSWGPAFVKSGDEIIVSDLEHHSNFVPWQMLCERMGARLVVAPTDSTGGLDLAQFEALLSARTKMVAVTHVSNVTGAILPVERIVELTHEKGALVLIDGCQAIPRMPVDLRAIGCDFYVFSGHKVYGPSGIGVLWGRYELLAAMPPWQTGGGMILSVTAEHTEFQDPPHRFEAGTPDISGAVGLKLALDFVESLGRDAIREHEEALTGYAIDRLSRIPDLNLLG